MSLINDALRKAQKQRTGEAPPLASMPAIGGESAVRIAKRARPAGFYSLLIRLGAAVVLLSVVIIGGVVLLRKKTGPVEVATPPAQSAVVQPSAPAQTAAPQPTATTFVVPVAVPPATPAPTTPKTATPVAPTETPRPVAPAVAPVIPKPEPAKPAAPGKLDPKAIQFIESLKVVGIRASTTDSKVLMNDRVYRIGSTVEHEMGIKLTGITANSLTFEDEHGGRYTRTF